MSCDNAVELPCEFGEGRTILRDLNPKLCGFHEDMGRLRHSALVLSFGQWADLMLGLRLRGLRRFYIGFRYQQVRGVV